jgi:hypothetical protein
VLWALLWYVLVLSTSFFAFEARPFILIVSTILLWSMSLVTSVDRVPLFSPHFASVGLLALSVTTALCRLISVRAPVPQLLEFSMIVGFVLWSLFIIITAIANDALPTRVRIIIIMTSLVTSVASVTEVIFNMEDLSSIGVPYYFAGDSEVLIPWYWGGRAFTLACGGILLVTASRAHKELMTLRRRTCMKCFAVDRMSEVGVCAECGSVRR